MFIINTVSIRLHSYHKRCVRHPYSNWPIIFIVVILIGAYIADKRKKKDICMIKLIQSDGWWCKHQQHWTFLSEVHGNFAKMRTKNMQFYWTSNRHIFWCRLSILTNEPILEMAWSPLSYYINVEKCPCIWKIRCYPICGPLQEVAQLIQEETNNVLFSHWDYIKSNFSQIWRVVTWESRSFELMYLCPLMCPQNILWVVKPALIQCYMLSYCHIGFSEIAEYCQIFCFPTDI